MRKIVIGLLFLLALFSFISAYSGVPRGASQDTQHTEAALVTVPRVE